MGADIGTGVMEFRPAPLEEERAAAEARIDWDKPIGYAHAENIIALVR